MSKSISYEWDIETIDINGDIVDHEHFDKIPNRPLISDEERLVLVRDNHRKGRSWAYVENGVLPDQFKDAFDHPVCRIPSRYRTEFQKSIHCQKP